MRTTLTLDDDVAAKLTAEARRTGRSFKDVVNSRLRLALNAKRVSSAPRFQVRVRPLDPVEGISFDNVEALLDQIEGPSRR
jgi:Ribbon-helix-helix protein, copG family